MGTNNSQLQPRILCVDDEPVGLTVRKLLLERKGYAVETASNGPSAIDMFKIRPFDLVLLDYYMPAMNGAEVARAMRTHTAESANRNAFGVRYVARRGA